MFVPYRLIFIHIRSVSFAVRSISVDSQLFSVARLDSGRSRCVFLHLQSTSVDFQPISLDFRLMSAELRSISLDSVDLG